MRKWKKPITILLSLALFCIPALQISASNISEAQQEKESLQKELEEAQDLIDNLQDSKDDIETKVTQLDAKLTDISGRINELQEQLDQKTAEIEDTKTELEGAQADEKEQYEQMKKRIRYMYENDSSMSLLEAWLSSGSIAEFISQTEYIKQIMEYDREMLEKYQDTKQTVADTKAQLESDYADLTEMKAQVEQEQTAVAALMEAKETELNSVASNLDTAEGNAAAVEAEIEAQNQIIAQIQAEEARKEAARQAAAAAAEEAAKQQEEQNQQGSTEQQSSETTGGGTTETPGGTTEEDTYNGGAFVWPCPSSTRVTSDYGERLAPTEGATTNHKGIDIGAAYGSAIVAAADGTVTYAGYGSATGNYIMLSHGDGLYTIYCHCSALLVATGDKVTAGATIAQVGSTGVSTGNHLHFGVISNGSYVSPWNYLSK